MPQLVYLLQRAVKRNSLSELVPKGPDNIGCLLDPKGLEYPILPQASSHGSGIISLCIPEPQVVEFRSVFIYTCLKSCWSEGQNGFNEESVFVLPDIDL